MFDPEEYEAGDARGDPFDEAERDDDEEEDWNAKEEDEVD